MTKACASCMRRRWLLSELNGPLDYCARDRQRLLALLALEDSELLKAVAGRRVRELEARYEQFDAAELRNAGETEIAEHLESSCCHRRAYPRALSGPAAARMLDVAGGAGRLSGLTAAPVVAIMGSRTASDYGMEIARSFARGLAASGVTVAAAMTDGIAVAAHAGALDANAGSIAVIGGGLGASCPSRRRALLERIVRTGCVVSELPWDCRGRRWAQLAAERTIVEVAGLVVFVEAELTPGDLAPARIAHARGRAVAAIPGRVTSPLSRGTHALLMGGASMVRNPRDVLELLHRLADSDFDSDSDSDCDTQSTPRPSWGDDCASALEPRLKAALARVGAGCDTPGKLARACSDPAEALLALSELELLGLLARGDGGRYVVRAALPG